MATKLRLTLAVFGIVSAVACGGPETPAATEPAGPAPVVQAPPVASAPKGPPPASIQENTYRLAFETDPAYGDGKDGKFRVVLTAAGGYHVNQDYPIRVDLKAPAGLKLTKASLGKPDATQFGEEAARFDVSFNAPKGTHTVEALVDFAVCTKETCVPDQRTIALNLQVM